MAPITSVDFFVPIIDNYGDAGFACSLALGLLERDESLSIRLAISDTALAGRMLGMGHPRIEVVSLQDFLRGALPSESVATFFGFRFPPEYREARGIVRELRFDYLQFDAGYHGHDGVASIHGIGFYESSTEVTHFVPSWVEAGGGVVLPSDMSEDRRTLADTLPIDDHLRAELLRHTDRPWISVFCYPPTVSVVREALSTIREPHLVLWHVDAAMPTQDAHSHVRIPFVPLGDYGRILRACDANIVRGENSLVASVALGRPTLWDTYRESNGAHAEKSSDYIRNLAELSGEPETALRYGEIQTAFIGSEDESRISAVRSFVRRRASYTRIFRGMSEHVRTRADIIPSVLGWIHGH